MDQRICCHCAPGPGAEFSCFSERGKICHRYRAPISNFRLHRSAPESTTSIHISGCPWVRGWLCYQAQQSERQSSYLQNASFLKSHLYGSEVIAGVTPQNTKPTSDLEPTAGRVSVCECMSKSPIRTLMETRTCTRPMTAVPEMAHLAAWSLPSPRLLISEFSLGHKLRMT